MLNLNPKSHFKWPGNAHFSRCPRRISHLKPITKRFNSSPVLEGIGSSGGSSGSGSGGGTGGGGDGNHREDENSDDKGVNFSWGYLAAIAGSIVLVLTWINKENNGPLLPTEDSPVSIIVPALNEAKTITSTINYLNSLTPEPAEIILVDGGSKDGTPQLARKAGAKVVPSRRGRGRQMNAGAAAASKHSRKGSKSGPRILMFVHADSRPPLDAIARVRRVLSDPGTVLGGFFTSIEMDNRVLLFSTFHNFISSYYGPLLFAPSGFFRGLKCMFGDQSLFCREEDFNRVGGFNDKLPIMEDADLCVRMHHSGLASGRPGKEVQLLGAVNRTSGRRIGSWGNVKSTIIQFRLSLAWWRGAQPEELWELYDTLYTDAFR